MTEALRPELEVLTHPLRSLRFEVESVHRTAGIVVAHTVDNEEEELARVVEFPLDSFPGENRTALQVGRCFMYTEFSPTGTNSIIYGLHLEPLISDADVII